MCGRYTMFASQQDVEDRFNVTVPALPPKRYNIAPTDEALVITWNAGKDAAEARLFRWGLIPHWAQDPAIGNRLINARAETLTKKPAFRSAFFHRRCLVVSTGFYEWRQQGTRKVPYLIHLPDYQLFAFAGLWESWQPPDAPESSHTFTLITVPPNEFVRQYHDRMPAMLLPEHEQQWIHPHTPPEMLHKILATPYPAEWLTAHRVSLRVNNPANDDPSLIEPVDNSP